MVQLLTIAKDYQVENELEASIEKSLANSKAEGLLD
jgi:hypothetical protein